MLRHLVICARFALLTSAALLTSTALLASTAQAAEAGKVIFASGVAKAGDKAAVEGAAVHEGELLTTGAQGFLYIKTIDKGLFILRPNTRARIVAYHIDAANPANTRIKLELLSGVARSRSGEAVKLARQNFRFNTPVAAIGVRGTDFTVFTDQEESRVAVISGGVIVSGFAGACSPEGSGPCEGATSRELSAAQRGLQLKVQRGQGAPVLMQGGALAPDQVAPPRGDEPIGKNGGVNASSAVVSAAPNLDAKKQESLVQAQTKPVAPPPVVDNGPVVPVPLPPALEPERQIVWGRFQPLLDKAVTIDFQGQSETGSELIAAKGHFALFRAKAGRDYAVPERGSVAFSMKNSEAFVTNDDPQIGISTAKLDNGALAVDFGRATFSTSFDLHTGGDVFKLRADGVVANQGRLYGNNQFSSPTNMSVDGVLNGENGGGAVYLFQTRLDATRGASGVTVWRK